MMSLRTLIAFFASCVIAQGGTISSNAPSSLTEDEYAAFFDSDRRNATGVVYFEGYNVSESFPPNRTITGWGARIEVATVDPGGDEQAYPGTRITFETPDDVVLPGNDSDWNSCISVFPPEWLKKSVRRKKADEDNSCSFLSDDCQSALLAAANGDFFYEGSCTGLGGVPEACEDHMSEEGATIIGYGFTNFSDTFDGSTAISYSPIVDGEESVDEAYDIAVGGYWTVLVNWGRRDPSSFSTDEEPQASVLCLKADVIENGSEGAAMRLLVDTVLILWMGFIATVWLM